jgi:hypothetical protein
MTVRWALHLLVAAVLLVTPAAAAADRTVAASVVAPATPRGDAAALPVLLSPDAARAYGRPVIAAVVRGKRPVRWGSDRLGLDQLRPGDRLTLRLRGTRARVVTLRVSGRGDSFDRVAAQLLRVGQTSQATLAQLSDASGTDATALRSQLTTLHGDLLALDADLDASLERLAALRPRQAGRRAAVAAAQQPYVSRLTAVRDQARVAAAQADAAAASVGDGEPIGESGDGTAHPSPPPVLPGNGSGDVSKLSNDLLALLEDMGLVEFSGGPIPLEQPNPGQE